MQESVGFALLTDGTELGSTKNDVKKQGGTNADINKLSAVAVGV